MSLERQGSSSLHHHHDDGGLGDTDTYSTPLTSPEKVRHNHRGEDHQQQQSTTTTLTPPLRARRFPQPHMGSSIPSYDGINSGNVSAVSSPQVGSGGGMRRANSSTVTTPFHASSSSSGGMAALGGGSSAFPPSQLDSVSYALGISCAQQQLQQCGSSSLGNSPQRAGGIPPVHHIVVGGTSPSSPPRTESPGLGPTIAASSTNNTFSMLPISYDGARTTSSSMLLSTSDHLNSTSKRTPTPTTPTQSAQMGGIDHAAVDVQGFYSQHQVNGVPVIPQELPRSPFLYVLTTSEGRDKLFKCLQYALKIGVWLCFRSDIIPEGSSAFAKTLALRLAGNVHTIRSGRSMFKLGRWIITLFHLQAINSRLMRKHTPRLYDQLVVMQELIGKAIESLGASIGKLGASVGLRGLPKPQKILSAPPSVMSSMDVCSEDEGEHSVRSNGGGPAYHATTPPLPPAGCVPRYYTNHAGEKRLSSSGNQESGAGSAAVSPSAVSPNRPRSVTFPTLSSSSHNNNRPSSTIHNNNAAAATTSDGDDDDRPFTTPPEVQVDHDSPTPASYAYASRWRRTAEEFSTPLMILLSLRCTLSVVRNMVRDGLFLSSREFIHAPVIQRRHHQLQKIANYSWMVVSLLDVALNTWRLADAGWLKFMSVRRNPRAYCLCDDQQYGTLHLRRHGDSISFAPLDFDFGSVTPTTAKFIEAAPPAQLQPICNHCGYVINSEANSGESTPKSADSHKPLFIPWLVRKGFDLVWVCGQHANLSQTLLLEIRYLSDVLLSAGYSVGDFEPAEGEEPLAQHLHLPASLAGFVSALIALHRVRLST